MSDRIKELADTTAPGTCQWIFNEPNFDKFSKDPEYPLLWIYGASGVGKSHLATSIVKHFGPSRLLGDRGATKGNVAAYFCWYNDGDDGASTVTQEGPYVDGGDRKQGSRTNPDDAASILIVGDDEKKDTYSTESSAIGDILQTLCWQLSEDDKEYERYLSDRLDQIQDEAGQDTTLLKMWNCLFSLKFFGGLQDRFVTLIIDGVDNLEEKERYRLYCLLRQIAQVS